MNSQLVTFVLSWCVAPVLESPGLDHESIKSRGCFKMTVYLAVH